MLKQRLITAACLIPVIFLAIFLLPSAGFLVVLCLVAAMAGWEWLSIIGITQWQVRLPVLAAILLLSLALMPIVAAQTVLVGVLGFWAVIALMTIVYANRSLPDWLLFVLKQPLTAWLLIFISLMGFIYSGLWLHGQAGIGAQLVVYLLLVVWLMDTGGYFFGKRFGQRKLAKSISPNKTWEGFFGGLLLVSVVFLLSLTIYLNGKFSLAIWLALTVSVAMASVVGDLFESLFKRCFQVKDSGQLLPGHGGMLDRIDSLLAAAPVFAAGLLLAGVS